MRKSFSVVLHLEITHYLLAKNNKKVLRGVRELKHYALNVDEPEIIMSSTHWLFMAM